MALEWIVLTGACGVFKNRSTAHVRKKAVAVPSTANSIRQPTCDSHRSRLLALGTDLRMTGEIDMKPTQQLIDELYLDKVRSARQMSPEQKFFAGPRLFERSCRIMLDGLRDENPDADDEHLKELLHERLALIRRARGRNAS